MGTARLDSERAGFDKWQMYKLVRGEDIGPCLVPKTARCTLRNLRRYVDDFHRVYIKPIGTWGGKNISLVERSGTSIVWTVQGKPSASSDLDKVLHHYDGVSAIVQEAIPARLYHGCPFDIRVHMQRDVDEAWVYSGELVRVGGPGIVSNVEISTGRVLPLAAALHEILSGEAQFEVVQRSLREVGHGICKLLDRYSHIEEVGIDLALDASNRLWLIEVNTNDAFGAPSHELFRYLPDQTIYEEIQRRASLRSMNTLELLFDMLAQDLDERN